MRVDAMRAELWQTVAGEEELHGDTSEEEVRKKPEQHPRRRHRSKSSR
jgi:hypothetical protein